LDVVGGVRRRVVDVPPRGEVVVEAGAVVDVVELVEVVVTSVTGGGSSVRPGR
jgi:hypothetical protein